MTLAQLASMCKGRCTCFPLLDLIVSFHKEGIHVAEPLYVSLDTPVVELPHGLDKVMVHGGWPQENGLKPWQEQFDWFGGWVRLCIDLEDVRRGAWVS